MMIRHCDICRAYSDSNKSLVNAYSFLYDASKNYDDKWKNFDLCIHCYNAIIIETVIEEKLLTDHRFNKRAIAIIADKIAHSGSCYKG